MSKRSDLVKSIVKKPIGEKPTFGTDPRDPWSAKYNVNEDAVLNTFLKSRGLNPLHVSKDQKVAHSKMGEFLKWKKDHMFSRPVSEAVDKKDTVTFDIPLLIRVLELTREDIKSDVDLHRVVERLIQIRNKGVLTMADYRMIASLPNIRPKHFKENHVAIAMGKMLDDEGSMALDQLEQLERAIDMIRTYVNKDAKKQLPAWVQSKITLATDYVDTVGNYLSSKNEEVEFQEASHDPWKDKHFGPTKIIKQKYHVKTDTKSYNVKADNEDHAHKLVTKHAPGSKIVSIEHKGRMMEEVEPIDEISKELTHSYLKKRYAQTGATRQDKPKGMPRATHDKQLMGLNRATRRLTTTLELPKGTDTSQGGKYTADSVEVNGDVIEEKSIDPNSSFLNKVGSFIHGSKPKPKSKTSLSSMRDAFKSDAKKTSHQSSSSGGNISYRLVRAEEVVTEGSAALRLAQALRKEREARELKDKSREAAEKNEKAKQPVQQQEAALEDPQSATQSPYDCANNPDDTSPKGKKLIQMSKSARIIKSIYKRKGMKEEIYDVEKEGKSIATYGKKPKLSDNEKKIEAVGGKPQAAAIMTGGTTLTGTPRDTVEIDPMMKPPKPGSLGQSDKPKNNNR